MPGTSAFFTAPESSQKAAFQPGHLLDSVAFTVKPKFCIETLMHLNDDDKNGVTTGYV